MALYRCWFTFKGMTAAVIGSEGVSEFKDGFWLTGDLQITKGAGAQYWIPPSQLQRIEKGVMP
jgi:hypothetical protein